MIIDIVCWLVIVCWPVRGQNLYCQGIRPLEGNDSCDSWSVLLNKLQHFFRKSCQGYLVGIIPRGCCFISIMQCSPGRKLCSCHSDHTSLSTPAFCLKQLCFLPFHISYMPLMNRIFGWTWVHCLRKFFILQNCTFKILTILARHVLFDEKCPRWKLSSKL